MYEPVKNVSDFKIYTFPRHLSGNFFSKKKNQDKFPHVRELRRLGTKRDQESYSPEKLDV